MTLYKVTAKTLLKVMIRDSALLNHLSLGFFLFVCLHLDFVLCCILGPDLEIQYNLSINKITLKEKAT